MYRLNKKYGDQWFRHLITAQPQRSFSFSMRKQRQNSASRSISQNKIQPPLPKNSSPPKPLTVLAKQLLPRPKTQSSQSLQTIEISKSHRAGESASGAQTTRKRKQHRKQQRSTSQERKLRVQVTQPLLFALASRKKQKLLQVQDILNTYQRDAQIQLAHTKTVAKPFFIQRNQPDVIQQIKESILKHYQLRVKYKYFWIIKLATNQTKANSFYLNRLKSKARNIIQRWSRYAYSRYRTKMLIYQRMHLLKSQIFNFLKAQTIYSKANLKRAALIRQTREITILSRCFERLIQNVNEGRTIASRSSEINQIIKARVYSKMLRITRRRMKFKSCLKRFNNRPFQASSKIKQFFIGLRQYNENKKKTRALSLARTKKYLKCFTLNSKKLILFSQGLQHICRQRYHLSLQKRSFYSIAQYFLQRRQKIKLFHQPKAIVFMAKFFQALDFKTNNPQIFFGDFFQIKNFKDHRYANAIALQQFTFKFFVHWKQRTLLIKQFREVKRRRLVTNCFQCLKAHFQLKQHQKFLYQKLQQRASFQLMNKTFQGYYCIVQQLKRIKMCYNFVKQSNNYQSLQRAMKIFINRIQETHQSRNNQALALRFRFKKIASLKFIMWRAYAKASRRNRQILQLFQQQKDIDFTATVFRAFRSITLKKRRARFLSEQLKQKLKTKKYRQVLQGLFKLTKSQTEFNGKICKLQCKRSIKAILYFFTKIQRFNKSKQTKRNLKAEIDLINYKKSVSKCLFVLGAYRQYRSEKRQKDSSYLKLIAINIKKTRINLWKKRMLTRGGIILLKKIIPRIQVRNSFDRLLDLEEQTC